MTTRDPRFRDRAFPDQGGGIDPTQSLSIDGEDVDRDSHPSLALGTHEAAEAAAREERTRIESPGARVKTPPPPAAKRPPPVPKGDGEPERVGQTLGSYKIVELLGKGGMGYVFRAEHVKLGREVALKLLRTDYAKRRDAVARFFQEARTVNRVRHRNIVDVTDFVELDDGTTFIIMEFLRGQSLGRWARTGIDMPRALAVLVQICDGLSAAHSVGVVHRDLKPDNVIVVPTSDGAELVKLLDFGVAKLLNRDDEDVGFQTQAGSVIGTPAYMSPEQAGGMAVDHRSDIYSLGAIMYELFCGMPMFRGRSFGEYVRKHLTELPVPPSQTEAGKLLDPRLEQLILCCLQKDPNQRFPTIGNLRDALLGILGAIETHPPGYATTSGNHSGHHVHHSGMVPRQLAPGVAAVMPTMLPASPQQQQQQMLATILPGGPGAPMPGLLPSAPYAAPASYTHHPSTYVPPQGTPWWVWAVGGAIAVGLGISAAVWYAGRDDRAMRALAQTQSPAPVRPIAEPIETEISVHFDATPRAQVFAEGNPSPLCQTPCPIRIDPSDGFSKTQRTFVLRAPGFQDESLIVDLAPSAPRAFRVPLDPAPTIPAQPPKPDELVVKTELEPEDPVPSKRPTKRPPRKSTRATAKPDVVEVPDEPRAAPPVAVEPKPKPKPKKPDPAKIDQAQTLDPFRKSP